MDIYNDYYFPAHCVYIDSISFTDNVVKKTGSRRYTHNYDKFTKLQLSLLSDYEISDDGRTATYKYEYDEPISEYFADSNYDGGETRHYSLRLFEDGSALRIITSRKYGDGTSDEWYDEYKKQ